MNCASCSGVIHDVIAQARFCPWCGKPRTPGAAVSAGLSDPARVRALAIELLTEAEHYADVSEQRLKRAIAEARASFEGRVSPELRGVFDEALAAPLVTEGARPISSYVGHLTLAYEPSAGFALVGAHEPPQALMPKAQRSWTLRAYDLWNKRVAWDSMQGTAGLDKLDREQLTVSGRTVYLALGRSLRALDLFTGQMKWGAEFSDKLETHYTDKGYRELLVVDPMPQGQRGVVLVATVDKVLTALDRETGQLVWKEKREQLPSEFTPIGEGLVLTDSPRAVLHPAQQAPVAAIDQPFERVAISGRLAASRTNSYGWREREGLLLWDLVANQERSFDPLEGIHSDVPPVIWGERVFATTERGAKLYLSPKGAPVTLREGYRVESMKMVGPTLFVLMRKAEGTDVRRILGVDPQTLGVRFDLGELTTEPSDRREHQIVVGPDMAVIVTSPDDDDDHCELWGVSPTGQVGWRTNVGEWTSHWFLGGHVVVRGSVGEHGNDALLVLRPNDGQIVMQYPEAKST